jgi:hypothetical protein
LRITIAGAFSLEKQLEVVQRELTPMIRWIGLGLIAVVMIGVSPPANAQMADHPYGADASPYGMSPDRLEPYGGFGLETTQIPMAGVVVIDRFGLAHGNPRALLSEPVPVRQPRAKATRSVPGRRAGRLGYQLPTGSLDWAGASGVIVYSPVMRYENYGGGYGRGPYGSVDCGMMYHGMSLGY